MGKEGVLPVSIQAYIESVSWGSYGVIKIGEQMNLKDTVPEQPLG